MHPHTSKRRTCQNRTSSKEMSNTTRCTWTPGAQHCFTSTKWFLLAITARCSETCSKLTGPHERRQRKSAWVMSSWGRRRNTLHDYIVFQHIEVHERQSGSMRRQWVTSNSGLDYIAILNGAKMKRSQCLGDHVRGVLPGPSQHQTTATMLLRRKNTTKRTSTDHHDEQRWGHTRQSAHLGLDSSKAPHTKRHPPTANQNASCREFGHANHKN